MMFRLGSETELREAFRWFEREEVELPASTGDFPVIVKNAMTWISAAGHRAFLIFAAQPGAKPMGIVFRRQPTGDQPAAMCDWCHSIKSNGGVSLLTATASGKHRIGLLLCSDLGCIERASADPEPGEPPRLESGHERIRRILSRMDEFARRSLF
jgi:hypothetical protein